MYSILIEEFAVEKLSGEAMPRPNLARSAPGGDDDGGPRTPPRSRTDMGTWAQATTADIRLRQRCARGRACAFTQQLGRELSGHLPKLIRFRIKAYQSAN